MTTEHRSMGSEGLGTARRIANVLVSEGLIAPDLFDYAIKDKDIRQRLINAAQPAAGERCTACEHLQDEHRTPGGECVHAYCSCDQSFEQLRDQPASEEGTFRSDYQPIMFGLDGKRRSDYQPERYALQPASEGEGT